MKLLPLPCVLFTFSIFLLALSCQQQQNKQEEQTEGTSLSLVITDSIRIDYPGLLDLMDVDPSRERVLLYDRQRGIILLTDFDGNHLLSLDKQGDEKGSYGLYLWSTAKIKEDDRIFLISQKGFFEFDARGELAYHMAFQDEVPFFSGRAAADAELIEHEGIFFQKGLVAWGEYNKTQDEYYDQFQLLVKFDPKKRTAERIIHLEAESPFRSSGKAFEILDMSPTFTVLDDKLLVIAGTDPHLNVYDIHPPHQLLERNPIAYPNYRIGQGTERAEADPKSITVDQSAGRTHTLKAFGDHLLATVSRGFDVADRERYKAISSREENSSFMESIAGKYEPALFLMDHHGENIQQLPLPQSLDYVQFLVREGELWWLSRLNADKEEDFVKIYKVEITETE
ncbi:hypothetical protein SAMN04488057_11444 [Cyclobacterium lianum]|uniref:TolB-like 6-blade propeller-like n=1 Tax=Cyclobacterium lianum TaxID=388280 RepID=A0A1M7Q5F7_9BACT|nr:hypothetical protein [Cyclobacterium lianum]SHN25630.1 hypothetical protein SAMN04488057_11444 [Cyclobacterium lianum]